MGQWLGLVDAAGKLKPVPFIQAAFAVVLVFFLYMMRDSQNANQAINEKQLEQNGKAAEAMTGLRDEVREMRRSQDRTSDLLVRYLIDVKRDTRDIKAQMGATDAVPPPRPAPGGD